MSGKLRSLCSLIRLFFFFSLVHLRFRPSPVRPFLCGGPPREEVPLPAAAPGTGFAGEPERGPQKGQIRPRVLGRDGLRPRRRHAQQLELRRGDPASRRHPSQVTSPRPGNTSHEVLQTPGSLYGKVVMNVCLCIWLFNPVKLKQSFFHFMKRKVLFWCE